MSHHLLSGAHHDHSGVIKQDTDNLNLHPSVPLTVYLERHGERADYGGASGNRWVDHAVQGEREDPPLTVTGFHQARMTARYVHRSENEHPKPCVIITSPFLRCLQTAYAHVEAIQKYGDCPGEEVRLHIENGLAEYNTELFKMSAKRFGKHPDMLSRFAENKAKFPVDDDYQSVHSLPDFAMETPSEADARLRTTLKKLQIKYADEPAIMLVTHQHCVNAMLPPDPRRAYTTPYCALSGFRPPVTNTIQWQSSAAIANNIPVFYRHTAAPWHEHFAMMSIHVKGYEKPSKRGGSEATGSGSPLKAAKAMGNKLSKMISKDDGYSRAQRSLLERKQLYMLPEEVKLHRPFYQPELDQYYAGSQSGPGVKIEFSVKKPRKGDMMFAPCPHHQHAIIHVATGLYLTVNGNPFEKFANLVLAPSPYHYETNDVWNVLRDRTGEWAVTPASGLELCFDPNGSDTFAGLQPVDLNSEVHTSGGYARDAKAATQLVLEATSMSHMIRGGMEISSNIGGGRTAKPALGHHENHHAR